MGKIKRNKKEWQSEYRQRCLKKKFSKKDLIQCKICGKWFVQIGTHVVQKHGMTAREYREEFGYDVKRGLVPEHYHLLKRKITLDNETYKNVLEAGKRFWFKKGDKVGSYKRSPQTLERLKKQGKIMGKNYRRGKKLKENK